MNHGDFVTLSITAEHISAACAEPYWCPIARAFCELVPLSSPLNIQLKDLPEEAHAFIRAFDRGHDVQPFSFTVRIVDGTGIPRARYIASIRTPAAAPAEP